MNTYLYRFRAHLLLAGTAVLLLLPSESEASAASSGFFLFSDADPGIDRSAEVDAAQLRLGTEALTLELGELGFVAERRRAKTKGEALLWVGRLRPAGERGEGIVGAPFPERSKGIAAFYRDVEGRVHGIVLAAGASYSLEPSADGGHTLLRERESADSPGCGLEGYASRSFDTPLNPPVLGGPHGFSEPWLVPTKQRVLVVGGENYTERLDGTAGLVARAELLVAVTNEIYANGGIPIDLELAHVHPGGENWPYPDVFVGLKDPSDGYYDDVPALRESHAADLVVLLLHRDSPWRRCGLAEEILGGEDTAFAYVASGGKCGSEAYTFAHEIGHLQGAAHDYQHAGHDGPSWAYGYNVPDGPHPFRTIMGYGDELPMIPFFSTPWEEHHGQPMGTEEAWNAYQLWMTRIDVGDYRAGDGASTVFVNLPYTSGLLSDDTDGERHFGVELAPSFEPRTLNVELVGGFIQVGDADLYVRAETKPTTTVYDCAETTWGNSHLCQIQNPPGGIYRIMIRGDHAYSGVQLEISLTEGGIGGLVP